MSATIALLYVSYSIPVVCQLIKGRDKTLHGPYWFGKLGLLSNVVLLVWTLYSVVIYALPAVMPVTAGSKSKGRVNYHILLLTFKDMNYISAVYGVLAIVIAADWAFRGRKSYLGNSVTEASEPTS